MLFAFSSFSGNKAPADDGTIAGDQAIISRLSVK